MLRKIIFKFEFGVVFRLIHLSLVDAGVPRREEGVDVALGHARRRRHGAEVALDLRGRLKIFYSLMFYPKGYRGSQNCHLQNSEG